MPNEDLKEKKSSTPKESTTLKEKPIKKGLRLSTSLIPSTELRNFIGDPLKFHLEKKRCENKNENDSEEEETFIGSEDELSLCTSDVDNAPADSTIQCSVISSCVDDQKKNVLNSQEKNPQETTGTTTEPKKIDLEFNLSIEKEISSISSSNSNASATKNNREYEIKNHVNVYESSRIRESDNEPLITNHFESSQSADNEQPGPSGYKKPYKFGNSDSDCSVIEVAAPQSKTPHVLNLVTNSEEENGGFSQGKQKKKKKMTVKEKLAKQEGVIDERDDIHEDLNCSVCLGPFEDRTFLKQCFHILFQWFLIIHEKYIFIRFN